MLAWPRPGDGLGEGISTGDGAWMPAGAAAPGGVGPCRPPPPGGEAPVTRPLIVDKCGGGGGGGGGNKGGSAAGAEPTPGAPG